MTPTSALANLEALTWEQLAALYTVLDRRARDAKTPTGATRAQNAREQVADEVSRRGLVVRSNRHYFDPITVPVTHYMVGRPEHFEPIGVS